MEYCCDECLTRRTEIVDMIMGTYLLSNYEEVLNDYLRVDDDALNALVDTHPGRRLERHHLYYEGDRMMYHIYRKSFNFLIFLLISSHGLLTKIPML